MAKTKSKSRTHFLCRACGGVQTRWVGRCPDCGEWDALERFVEPKPLGDGEAASPTWSLAEGDLLTPPVAQSLPEIEVTAVRRLPSGLPELDRVLGGGFVPGSVVLLGGDPGIGKSTLLLQALGPLVKGGERVLYATSEESAFQTRLRAERLFAGAGEDDADLERLADLYVMADTNLARIMEQARKIKPALMVIDSIQMVYNSDLEAAPGSLTQLRRCCTDLVMLAKRAGTAVVLVGHVTKDGHLAGPKLLEHLVDAVLSFEGDRHHAHRVVRGIKNRYGTTLEVGLFEMTGRGLREVDLAAGWDPSRSPHPGTALCPVVNGTRATLIEIQALTATGLPGNAKRRVSGLDANRLAVLIAVLEKHGGLRLSDQDVFTSAVGGLRVIEPAADLAVCLAIAGAHRRLQMQKGIAVAGEVGLGGEVRAVHQLEQRAREASRLGYRTLLTADGCHVSEECECRLHVVRTLSEALECLSG